MERTSTHLFLTGEKQVGKSTLLRRLSSAVDGRVAGFRTVRTDSFLHDRYSVHMLPAGQEEAVNSENLLFICRTDNPDKDARFDRLGCVLLENVAGASLIVMDELGPNEMAAKAFQHAVMNVLDGDVPILGVLQKAESTFLQEVASHPKVEVIEVTAENRDEWFETLIKRHPFASGEESR